MDVGKYFVCGWCGKPPMKSGPTTPKSNDEQLLTHNYPSSSTDIRNRAAKREGWMISFLRSMVM
jgi:hypothetical protein